jgi:hypothetical protein
MTIAQNSIEVTSMTHVVLAENWHDFRAMHGAINMDAIPHGIYGKQLNDVDKTRLLSDMQGNPDHQYYNTVIALRFRDSEQAIINGKVFAAEKITTQSESHIFGTPYLFSEHSPNAILMVVEDDISANIENIKAASRAEKEATPIVRRIANFFTGEAVRAKLSSELKDKNELLKSAHEFVVQTICTSRHATNKFEYHGAIVIGLARGRRGDWYPITENDKVYDPDNGVLLIENGKSNKAHQSHQASQRPTPPLG